MLAVLAYSLIASVSMPLGAWIASRSAIVPRWNQLEIRHAIIAFGAGALLSAVALVLVPKGIAAIEPEVALLSFFVGSGLMLAVDRALDRSGSRRAQLLAMLSDFVPEAVAMGALFAYSPASAPLLALLIGLQNLPEAFNAYHEAEDDPKRDAGHLVRTFALLALLGPAATLSGYLFLADLPEVTGVLMCAAAGGILYLMFQDIAPQVKLKRSHLPPLGAVAGFMLGLAGDLYLHG